MAELLGHVDDAQGSLAPSLQLRLGRALTTKPANSAAVRLSAKLLITVGTYRKTVRSSSDVLRDCLLPLLCPGRSASFDVPPHGEGASRARLEPWRGNAQDQGGALQTWDRHKGQPAQRRPS